MASKPAISSNGSFYANKATEFLQDVDRVAHDQFNWTDNIGVVFNTPPFYNNLDEGTIKALWGRGTQSKVGKGNQTVTDTEVRKSKELLADHVQLNPDFVQELEIRASKMLDKDLHSLGKPTFHFYKMVVYQKGDHFTWHIDSNHRENMFATMSVQLHVLGENEGGELILSCRDNIIDQSALDESDSDDSTSEVRARIRDDSMDEAFCDLCEAKTCGAPHPDQDQVSVAVFYHDTPHMVTEVESGYRVSLIFDITLEPQIYALTNRDFEAELKHLRKQGVHRVGFLCNHIYMGESLEPALLKGTDRYTFELLKKYTANVDLVELVNADGSLCRAELMPLFSFLDMEVWQTVDWDNPEDLKYVDSEQGALIEDTGKREQSTPVPSAFMPKFDDGTGIAVADEYRLGDVLFFKSIGPARLTSTGNSEIHLGNNGFYGTIYEQAAVIAEL